MKEDERFKEIYNNSQTGMQIWVDKERGVNYLVCQTAVGVGITPLLEKDGKPVVSYGPGSYSIDIEKCIGCGLCAKQCPSAAITRTSYIATGHKLPSMAIDGSKCTQCDSCVSNCKFGAVKKI